jgi:hypothetical protein
MNVALWMVQGILAFAFVTSGRINAFAHEQAYPNMTWVHSLPSALVTFIGVCELAGAVGVIVPWAFGVQPLLTPFAAVGLATIMVLAIAYHLAREELSSVVIANLVLLSLSLFVAWGRWSALRGKA